MGLAPLPSLLLLEREEFSSRIKNCKSWVVSSKLRQREKKVLTYEDLCLKLLRGSSSPQGGEGKCKTAQGGNALNTRLLGNGNGNYGLRSKCWNSWQVNPQAQLPREQVCGKLIAVVLILQGFSLLLKIPSPLEKYVFTEWWKMGRDLLTLSCWVPALIHKPWQMRGQQGSFLCVRLFAREH